MSAREVVGTVHRADPVLSVVGWLHVLLALVLVVILPWDSREVMGINPWLKPIKFAISIALYLWTLAWYLRYIEGPRWAKRLIRWGAAGAMLTEIFCIVLQAARGTTSHYNVSTPFDASVFNAMGLGILFNTLLIMLLLFQYLWQEIPVATAYRMGLRLGLMLFLIGSMEGMLMIFNAAHTIGAPDGGPGLPFLNWSTQAGDLRVAHVIGLHALQILPLLGYWISKHFRTWTPPRQALLVVLCALLYTAAFAFAFREAAAGIPLLRL